MDRIPFESALRSTWKIIIEYSDQNIFSEKNSRWKTWYLEIDYTKASISIRISPILILEPASSFVCFNSFRSFVASFSFFHSHIHCFPFFASHCFGLWLLVHIHTLTICPIFLHCFAVIPAMWCDAMFVDVPNPSNFCLYDDLVVFML